MNRISRSALLVVTATGLSLVVGGTAFAADNTPNPPVPSAPSAPLDSIGTTKARCDAAIDKRVAHLAAWTARVDGLMHLTDGEKSALTGGLANVSKGLTTVAKPAVDNATDKASLRAACKAVVLDYRVYKVVHPQVFLSAGADGVLDVITTLQSYSADLKSKGANTDDVDALLTQALTTAQGVPTNLAQITPASYNSDPAATGAVFADDRAALKTTRMEIRQARTMLRKLAKGIQA